MNGGTQRRSPLRLVLIVAGLVVLSSVAVLLRLRSQAPEAAGAKEAIERVLDSQVVAWNLGDLDNFMHGYWRSPELSFFSGNDRTNGWEATLQRFRQRYQVQNQDMGMLKFGDIEIELLGPESAYVRGRWQLTLAQGGQGGVFTLIFRKLPEGWRIVHDHTSKVEPAAAPE
jgi:beta-aspartyl-peptidase (threonine type)